MIPIRTASADVHAGCQRRRAHVPPRAFASRTEGEIAGHLHPAARIAQRGRAVSRRCFVTDGNALVMPAFGAYTGGLNIRDRAFFSVFGSRSYTAHMLGENRLAMRFDGLRACATA